VNRYEILIGKAPPFEPPEPSEPPEPPKVREILVGKRRVGKTSELINCIRKTVDKGREPRNHIYLYDKHTPYPRNSWA